MYIYLLLYHNPNFSAKWILKLPTRTKISQKLQLKAKLKAKAKHFLWQLLPTIQQRFWGGSRHNANVYCGLFPLMTPPIAVEDEEKRYLGTCNHLIRNANLLFSIQADLTYTFLWPMERMCVNFHSSAVKWWHRTNDGCSPVCMEIYGNRSVL